MEQKKRPIQNLIILLMKHLCFILSLIFIGCQPANKEQEKNVTPEIEVEAKNKNSSKAYVLQNNEGEVLLDNRGRPNIIKVSPETGANHLTFGVQQMPAGSGIITHRHDETEEILFVHEGSGIAIINGDTVKIKKGATLFIPPGTSHGIQNPNDSMDILFVTTPQGLEKLFRGFGSSPGDPFKDLTKQQIDSIEKISDSKALINQ